MSEEKDIKDNNLNGKTNERDLTKSLTHDRPDPLTNPPTGRLTTTTESNENSENSSETTSEED